MKEKWNTPHLPATGWRLVCSDLGVLQTLHLPVLQGIPHYRTRERTDKSYRDQTLNTDRNNTGFLLSA